MGNLKNGKRSGRRTPRALFFNGRKLLLSGVALVGRLVGWLLRSHSEGGMEIGRLDGWTVSLGGKFTASQDDANSEIGSV